MMMATSMRTPVLRAPCSVPRCTRSVSTKASRLVVRAQQQPTERPTSKVDQINHHVLLAAAMMAPALLSADPAMAINREYGILEGTILSLAHPAVMGALFGITVYAGWLGFKWRETRTIPETIKELKLQLPAANAEGIRPPSEVENKITELEATRKELIKGKFADRHEVLGSLLLGGGVLFSVSGALNTYIRTGAVDGCPPRHLTHSPQASCFRAHICGQARQSRCCGHWLRR